MTKNDKSLNKLRTAKTLTWRDVTKAMSLLGFVKVEAAGSRVLFENGIEGDEILLHKPHPQNELKAYALKQLRESLKERGFL